MDDYNIWRSQYYGNWLEESDWAVDYEKKYLTLQKEYESLKKILIDQNIVTKEKLDDLMDSVKVMDELWNED